MSRLEACATHGRSSLFVRKLQLLAETFIAWIFFKTGWKAGEFDPMHYTVTIGRNADFRKFEDGLKMTLDADEESSPPSMTFSRMCKKVIWCATGCTGRTRRS